MSPRPEGDTSGGAKPGGGTREGEDPEDDRTAPPEGRRAGGAPEENRPPESGESAQSRPGFPEEARKSLSRTGIKMAVLVLAGAACLAVMHFTPLSRHLRDVQGLKHEIQATGPWAPVLFTLGTAALVGVGLPRLASSGLGGLLFGFGLGLALSLAGSIVGSYCTFLFARWAGREWVERRFPPQTRIRLTLDQPSVASVFWIRQLPITGFFISSFLGLTAVRHPVFLAGSLLGFVPTAAIVALIGSGLGKESRVLSLLQIGLALAGVGVLALGVLRLRRGMHAAKSV